MIIKILKNESWILGIAFEREIKWFASKWTKKPIISVAFLDVEYDWYAGFILSKNELNWKVSCHFSTFSVISSLLATLEP